MMNFEMFDPTRSAEVREKSQRRTGGLMIVVGIIFIVAMSEIDILGHSPWMLMALVPVYWSAMRAYKYFRADGGLSARVLISIFFTFVPFGFMAAAMSGLNMGLLMPVGFIGLGLVFLLSSRG